MKTESANTTLAYTPTLPKMMQGTRKDNLFLQQIITLKIRSIRNLKTENLLMPSDWQYY